MDEALKRFLEVLSRMFCVPSKHPREAKAGKMKRAGRIRILALGLGLWTGLGLVATYFLGWLVGIAAASLAVGLTFIVIDALSQE